VNTNCALNNFTHRFTPKDDVKPYDIYGVTVGEVEVDLLTGQHQVSCLYIVMCSCNQINDCIIMGLNSQISSYIVKG
jgi:xanthine dehydrogenase molybdopterin-binding subunit B